MGIGEFLLTALVCTAVGAGAGYLLAAIVMYLRNVGKR